MSKIKHSITLYSFATKYGNGKMNFEDCMRTARDLGGDGIELVAPQMVPSYPYADEAFKKEFFAMCDKYGMDPVCYSGYIDLGIRPGKMMTDHEKYDSTIRDLEIAYELGFKIMRTQFALTPKIMEKCLPFAEKLGVHLAIELHTPHVPSTPIWQEYLELFERADSPYLGVVPDMSSFCYAPPATFFNLEEDGDQDALAIRKQLLAAFEAGEDKETILALNEKLGGDPVENGALIEELFYRYFRDKVDYDGLARLLKYSRYIHGKFYYVSDDFQSKGIDYPRIVKIIKDSGFDGYICSEYEGDQYDLSLDVTDQIRTHIKYLDKLWAEC